jgi:hypothetical protein
MFATIRATLVVWIAAALMLVGAGALLGGFLAQRPGAELALLALRSDQAAQALMRSEFEAQLRSAHSRFETSQGDLMIERAARAELEKNLAIAQTELGRLKDSLAFYEQLLPPGPQGSIALRAVDLELKDHAISYRVLLMRSGKSGERFAGMLQFVAVGLERGTETTYTLKPLHSRTAEALSPPVDPRQADDRSDRATETLRLEFEQFQRSQGLLALPDGFEPKSVTVQVLEGGIVLVSRRVDL